MRYKVQIGSIETDVPDYELDKYLSNGWKVVEEKTIPTTSAYDKFDDKQIDGIAKNKNITFEKETKAEKLKTIKAEDVKTGLDVNIHKVEINDGLILGD